MRTSPAWVPLRIRQIIPLQLRVALAFFLDVVFLPSAEQTEERVLRNSIQRGDVVFEVGARVGGSTRLISELVGDRGRVFAFEPNPHSFRVLKLNTRSLRNVKVYNYAVDRTDGILTLTAKTRYDAGANTLTEGQSGIKVKSVSIDNFIEKRQIRKVDAIIIDAEGAEYRALEGAGAALKEVRFLSVEVHHYICSALEKMVTDLLLKNDFFLEERLVESTDPYITVNCYNRTQVIEK